MKLKVLLLVASAVLCVGWFAAATSRAVLSQELTREQVLELRKSFSEAYTLQKDKKFEESNKIFEKLLEKLPETKGSKLDPTRSQIHYRMACNFAGLEDKKQAFSQLDLAVEKGYWDHEFLQADPTFASFKDENEFQALVERSRRGIGEMVFGLKDLDGKEIRKEDLKNKVLVLDVWGTWCPPCRAEIPHYVKLQEKYAKQGLQVIGLAWEQRAPDASVKQRVKNFASKMKMNYPVVLISPELLQSIPNLEGFPTTFFVGRDGSVRKRSSGGKQYFTMENTVRPLLAE